MTALEKLICAEIERNGAMPIDRYMVLCLGHPEHGYYMKQDPFGASGDFTTSPEISQVFGELIGIWIANLKPPKDFSLVELGPGRGTLMKDMLRVLTKVGFTPEVHLVETSLVLRAVQKQTIGMSATWHDSIATLPSKTCYIIANEFFDAIPIQQFEKRDGTWFERCVGRTGDKLRIGLKPTPFQAKAENGAIAEVAPQRSNIATALAQHIATHGGAALFIDYGHAKSDFGDTLQAMHKHKYCNVLESPGDCDITSHVDFEALQKAAGQGGAMATHVITQGQFLNALGLAQRVEALTRNLTENDRKLFESGAKRLAAPSEMGDLFKVMAVTQKAANPPYPLEHHD